MSFRVPNSWRVHSGFMRSDDSFGNNGAFTLHLHCLHLWRPVTLPMPTPPSWMVGPKESAA